MSGTLKIDWDAGARDPGCLRDESRMSGYAAAVVSACCEQDVVEAVRQAAAAGESITVQGARTGIAGGAVPRGGWVLNLSKMNRLLGMGRAPDGRFTVWVEPGLTLAGLRAALQHPGRWSCEDWDEPSRLAYRDLREAGPHFFPPDLTETGASIGGVVACNGSGARTFRYGAARRSIVGLRVVLADGRVVSLRRGRDRAEGRRAVLVFTEGGGTLDVELPDYTIPDIKNAAGYYSAPDMDLVDLFVGSEGTLGVVVAAELALLPVPGAMWGATCFFPDESLALSFVRAVRGAGETPAAIEYFDSRAISLLSRLRGPQGAATMGRAAIPVIPDGWSCAVYVEYHAASSAEADEGAQMLATLLTDAGGDPDASWFAGSETEIDRFKGLRHAVPEAVNMQIDLRRRSEPGLTKLGTDLVVPDARLEQVMQMYHADLAAAGLDYVIFGHIGNNHVHVNILPRNQAEYETGKTLYLAWCRQVVSWGGSVAGEHGIGKLKRAMLELMYGDAGMAQMRRVKRALDPQGRLGPGTLFEPDESC